ncbi:MAG: HAMP domain-containing histidine kinase [Bifidobacteriaceae bacterium]|jgi:signal transduction histidine kinase|nr:HAMP domain-containing histidine kinase [Bifidobacteriaceae bacterium]
MLATTMAVAVAVMLLGVPLTVFAGQWSKADAKSEVQNRADALAAWLDSYGSTKLPVRQTDLDSYLSRSSKQLPVHIDVELRDGPTMQAGDEITGPKVELKSSPLTAAKVRFQVSWWALQLRSLPAIGLVILACLAAMSVGAAFASRQARRLSAPMVYLSATAEQLGSGHLRIRPPRAGIEEIDLVAEELARSGDRMAKRLAVERQFASDASHQLRTPLTALAMRLEEIEYLSTQKDTQADVREEARVCMEQIERLANTIDELLGRTKSGSGSPRRWLRLSQVFHQQQEEWLPVFAEVDRSLVVDVDESLTVTTSPGVLSQVIATLLENALKHGEGVTTLRGRKVKGGVAIEVQDEGPGVSPELAPKIFERSFSTGGSTGLGLAVARDLVAAEGGRLELSQRQPPVFTVFLSSPR